MVTRTPVDRICVTARAERLFAAACEKLNISALEDINDQRRKKILIEMSGMYGAGAKTMAEMRESLSPACIQKDIDYAKKHPWSPPMQHAELIEQRLLQGSRLSRKDADWIIALINSVIGPKPPTMAERLRLADERTKGAPL